MKKRFLKSAILASLLLATGGLAATEVFDVWGYGYSWEEARNDARAVGEQQCVARGYFGAYVEEVQTYQSGGGYISYGIAQCN